MCFSVFRSGEIHVLIISLAVINLSLTCRGQIWRHTETGKGLRRYFLPLKQWNAFNSIRLQIVKKFQQRKCEIVIYIYICSHVFVRYINSCIIIMYLIQLHWLPVEQCIIYKIILMTFKALYELTPQYIMDLISHYVPARNL